MSNDIESESEPGAVATGFALRTKEIAQDPVATAPGSDSIPNLQLQLTSAQIGQIVSHARKCAPQECCGLIGGTGTGRAQTIYQTRNIAVDPIVTYEAAPEDLFAAQREMRARGEQLIAIYHSHPRAKDPQPSATDVRLAYYPSAVYLIVGLGNDEPCMRAFRINEREGWQPIEYQLTSELNR